MSAVYNPEADTIARIEALEMEFRRLRRRLEACRNAEDLRVLRRQLAEITDQITFLQNQLP